MEVNNKVVIITGASAGIGLATAEVFSKAGSKLALVARSTEALEQLADKLHQQGTEVMTVTADVSVKSEVERMVSEVYQHFGRIDILINNAGQAAGGPVATVNNDHFHKIVELNVFGPLYAIQAVTPKMKEHGGGMIINVSSMVSKLRIPSLAAYSSTKYALNAISQTARIELAPDKIKVVTVYPGLTATNFSKNALRDAGANYRAGGDQPQGDPPEKVAQKILAAALKDKSEQYMGFGSRLISTVSSLAPGLIDKAISRRSRQNPPAAPTQNGNSQS